MEYWISTAIAVGLVTLALMPFALDLMFRRLK